jgi:hypothetical protein
MAKKITPTQESELTIEQKWELLNILKHERMQHVTEFHILDAGTKGFKYSFSEGNDLRVKESLDPEKDAKLIATIGRKYRQVTLPGKYVNRMKVVDTIQTEDFLTGEDAIKAEYTKFLSDKRAKKKQDMLDNPDATAEMLSEMLKNSAKKAEAQS